MIDDDTKTLWCGNLSDQVTEELLYELFLQAGPLEKVRIPRDRDGRQKNFAFITYCHEVSVPYAMNLFRGTALFNRTLNLQNKGRMNMLPPPIRCYGLEVPMNFQNQDIVAQQFSEMTERMRVDNPPSTYMPIQHQEMNDKLVMASLQGNWSHRHHPYRSKDKLYNRDDHRYGESHNDYKNRNSKHCNNWRDRRNHHTRRRE